LTRYRKTNLPPPPPTVDLSAVGRKQEKTFLWMPDAEGNLVKKEASTVKKSFAKLSESAQIALTEYLIRVQNKVPTDAARRSLFNSIVDGAVAAYKEGKKQTPWDVLGILKENAPALDNQTVNYVQYDRITADALLNQIAESIGFNAELLTDDDRNDFLAKINEQAKAGGKTVTREVTGGGVETITTPAVFNAKDFAQNYIWAKVNLQDPTTLPSSVINQISSINDILNDNGIQLSEPEVAQISLDISSGKKSLDTIKAEFSDMAGRMYPQLAERLKATPGLTVRQAVSPLLNNIAKAWEVDVRTLDINDPRIDQLIRPDGIVGKEPPKTNYDVYQWAVNQPEYESTTDAISKAQQSALSLAKAMGFGV
jgi:hypothetical protein